MNNYPKLHNATWPGVVGKGPGTPEPFIDLDTILDLTAAAEVDGVRFDGVISLTMRRPDAGPLKIRQHVSGRRLGECP